MKPSPATRREIDAYLELAIQSAREAGAIQRKHWGGKLKIRMKGPIDPVTQVDLACEKLILSKIHKAFPDHAVLAEESGATGDRSDETPCWIVDPLDGTVNFTHAYPKFACSIAVRQAGVTLAGAIYDPVMHELFTAAQGKGARLNGKPIHVSEVTRMDRALLTTGFAYNVRTSRRNNIGTFSRMLKQAQAVRRDGCAALNLCYVACGRFDGFWELYLHPWDIAAGDIIVREAGGKTGDYKNRGLDLFGPEIVASNGKLQKALCAAVGARSTPTRR